MEAVGCAVCYDDIRQYVLLRKELANGEHILNNINIKQLRKSIGRFNIDEAMMDTSLIETIVWNAHEVITMRDEVHGVQRECSRQLKSVKSKIINAMNIFDFMNMAPRDVIGDIEGCDDLHGILASQITCGVDEISHLILHGFQNVGLRWLKDNTVIHNPHKPFHKKMIAIASDILTIPEFLDKLLVHAENIDDVVSIVEVVQRRFKNRNNDDILSVALGKYTNSSNHARRSAATITMMYELKAFSDILEEFDESLSLKSIIEKGTSILEQSTMHNSLVKHELLRASKNYIHDGDRDNMSRDTGGTSPRHESR